MPLTVCAATAFATLSVAKVWYNYKKRTLLAAMDASRQASVKSASDSVASARTTSTELSSRESPQPVTSATVQMVSVTSQASFPEPPPANPAEEPFVSRFLTDFEPIRRLGKGGFGVVYEAKNKMDESEYAIKRIPLCKSEAGEERTMREVRALAKLDHAGIVRYHQAWVETPPPRWQARADRRILPAPHCGDSVLSSGYVDEHSDLLSPDLPKTAESAKAANSLDVIQPNLRKLAENVSLKNGFLITNCTDISERRSVVSKNNYDSNTPNSFNQLALEATETRPGDLEEPCSSVEQPASGNGAVVFANTSSANVEFANSTSAISPIFKRRSKRDAGTTVDLQAPDGNRKKDRQYLYIQMQLCQKCTLREWLQEKDSVQKRAQEGEQLVLDWFAQILQAMHYVHECGLIHRDLKPSNIFFSLSGQIKIGDFGLATEMLEDSDFDEDETNDNNNLSKKDKHTDCVGTRIYMSPEQVYGGPYTHKVDVYSLGLILMELLVPFETQMERLQTLNDVRKMIFPPTFAQEKPIECALVQQLVSRDPEARPDCYQILESPLFEGVTPSTRPAGFTRQSRTSSGSGGKPRNSQSHSGGQQPMK